MVSDEYIHINEAAEIYGRTRQTFYNYVNKGLIATNKINNKLYLKKSDIEKLVNDYIEVVPNSTFSSYSALAGAHQDISQEAIPTEEIIQHIPSERYEADEEIAYTKGPYANIHSLNNLQDDLLRLHKQLYELRDELLQQLATTQNELMFDTKNNLYTQEQKIFSAINLQNKEVEHLQIQQSELITHAAATHLSLKKFHFWLGYAGFIAVNAFVLRGILL